MFKLIYPKERYVSEQQIRLWVGDAIANDDVDYIGDKQIIAPNEVQTAPIEFCIEILQNTGKFTFAKF